MIQCKENGYISARVNDVALLSKIFEIASIASRKGIAEIEVVGPVCKVRTGH